MKKRAVGFLLSLALVLSLTGPFLVSRPQAVDSVYFTAVNENLCPLNDATMPFWSGGNLYVPSTVFSSYDLGISYARDTSSQTALLYTGSKTLEFDLANGGANNTAGIYYSARAVTRQGYICFPLAFVSSYFGLSYSIQETPYVPLVRVRSSPGLSDSQFIDAASTLMASRYNAYLQSKKTPTTKPNSNPGSESSQPAVVPPGTEETEIKNTTQVLLAVRAGEDEALTAMLNTLDRYGYKATFFFAPDALTGRDDLLRRIVSSGHRLGLIQPSDGDMEALQRANELLRRSTGTTTRMVLASQSESALAAGYAVYTPSLSAENLGSTASGRAARIMSGIEAGGGTVKVLLGGDDLSASALNTVCMELRTDNDTVRAVDEVACGGK